MVPDTVPNWHYVRASNSYILRCPRLCTSKEIRTNLLTRELPTTSLISRPAASVSSLPKDLL